MSISTNHSGKMIEPLPNTRGSVVYADGKEGTLVHPQSKGTDDKVRFIYHTTLVTM